MIHTERSGSVAVVTIDRQERRNAVDRDALDALMEAIDGSTDARALVLTGAGGHFCAGADLTALEDSSFALALREVLEAFGAIPVPTIAAVEGAALGAGLQLAAACDLRISTPDARFGIPAAKLGLMVDHWTVRRVAAFAGQGPARAMLMAAEVLSGADAHRLGLVQRLGDFDDALAWATEIAGLAPLTIAGHKLMLERLDAPDGDPDIQAAFSQAWGSKDLAEGRRAFAERRAPQFHGE